MYMCIYIYAQFGTYAYVQFGTPSESIVFGGEGVRWEKVCLPKRKVIPMSKMNSLRLIGFRVYWVP